MKKVKLFEEFIGEGAINLNADHLSSSEYQKANNKNEKQQQV